MTFDIENLDEQLKSIDALISANIGVGAKDNFARLVSFLFNNQQADGSWGPNDFVIWQPVQTALAIELLSRVGVRISTIWEIAQPFEKYQGGLKYALKYLLSVQRPDGSWGEDFWDCCAVLKAFHLTGYEMPTESKILALQHIRDTIIKNDFENERRLEWYGAGFLGIAIELFSLLGEKTFTDELVKKVLETQERDGSFSGPKDKDGNYSVPKIWHTAQVLIGLGTHGYSSRTPRIAAAIEWLKRDQNSDGSWGSTVIRYKVIYTGQAVYALSVMGEGNSEEALKAVEWLYNLQDSTGRIVDIPGTNNAGLALARWLGSGGEVRTELPLNLIYGIKDLLVQQNRALQSQQKRLESLEIMNADLQSKVSQLEDSSQKARELSEELIILRERYANSNEKVSQLSDELKKYWVKWTDKDIAIIGFVVSIIGIVLAFIFR